MSQVRNKDRYGVIRYGGTTAFVRRPGVMGHRYEGTTVRTKKQEKHTLFRALTKDTFIIHYYIYRAVALYFVSLFVPSYHRTYVKVSPGRRTFITGTPMVDSLVPRSSAQVRAYRRFLMGVGS